jgi:hypothetical protein
MFGSDADVGGGEGGSGGGVGTERGVLEPY